MFDLWGSENSVLREKVVEHLFFAELSKEMLLRARTPFEVLRSEFDGHGYDAVVEAEGIVRHIQFKHSRADSKVTRQKINRALTRKPGGCVIWSMVDRDTMELGPFYWLGGKPGERLGNLGDRIAKHTKGDQHGTKGPREAIRVMNRGEFERITSMAVLATRLFGDIYGRMNDHRDHWMDLSPPKRRWAEKTHFAPGLPSDELPPDMWIEVRSGSITGHFRYPDGRWLRQSEAPEDIDFRITRDGFYDLGGGYLGNDPPK